MRLPRPTQRRTGFLHLPESLAWGFVVWALTLVFIQLILPRVDFRDFTGLVVLASCIASLRLSVASTLVITSGGIVLFNYLFIPPRFDLDIYHKQDMVMLGTVFATSLLTSVLTSRLRVAMNEERESAQRSEAQIYLTAQLANTSDPAKKSQLLLDRLRDEGLNASAMVTPHWPVKDIRKPGLIWVGKASPPERRAMLASVNELTERGSLSGRDNQLEQHVLPLTSGGRSWGSVLIRTARDDANANPPMPLKLIRTLCATLAGDLERTYFQQQVNDLDRARHNQALRSTLLTSVAHDFRTPIAAMLTTVDNLRSADSPSTAQIQTSCQQLGDELRRLQVITTNTLQLARLEHLDHRLPTEWENLQEIAMQARDTLASHHPHARLQLDLGPEPALVQCNATLVQQALFNLLDNAARHCPAGTPITLTIASGASEFQLEVADLGPGMAAADRAMAFEPFKRGPEQDSRPGFGLGLALCKAVSLAHAGSQLELKANHPQGLRAVWAWPRTPMPPAPDLHE
ncbi:MAG: ATP-binding protein [Limnobacter sp.]|uniref:ATP-binding protein n=1 Tax=Limnobacter sp. TaxID=2003368 RepID=UPI00391A117D